MTKLLIASTDDPDMRYAAGISVPDPFILVDTGKKRTLLLSSLEYARGKKALGRKRGYAILLLDPLYQEARKEGIRGVGSLLAHLAARYLKRRGIRKVVVSPKMGVAHVEQLRKEGIKVALAPLYPQRAVKTEAELAAIRQVRNAAVVAMRHCITIIKEARVNARGELVHDGRRVTSERLRREARALLLAHDCEARSLIISHGAQTAVPHDEGSGVLRTGEPVVLDFFPRSLTTGYWFDMTRTVCHGAAPPALRRLYRAVKRAQDAALATVRPGVTTGVVHAVAARVLADEGYATTDEEGFIHSTGHGLGLEIHEAPSIREGEKTRLKEGMVIAVEPGLYYSKIGGVRLENTVVVTKEGYRDLTRMERRLRG